MGPAVGPLDERVTGKVPAEAWTGVGDSRGTDGGCGQALLAVWTVDEDGFLVTPAGFEEAVNEGGPSEEAGHTQRRIADVETFEGDHGGGRPPSR